MKGDIQATIRRDLDQGRARFLAKPFDRKQLVAEVEQALSSAE
jgi:FixJ family two-component response regulator